MDDRPVDGRALVNEVEGHLLIEATRREGRCEAGRFTRQFGWLTESQRTEVEERFTEEYVSLARLSWQRTAQRSAELRGEYEEAYRELRQRVLAAVLFGTACLIAVAVLAFSCI